VKLDLKKKIGYVSGRGKTEDEGGKGENMVKYIVCTYEKDIMEPD
jgi:hypothetical protein